MAKVVFTHTNASTFRQSLQSLLLRYTDENSQVFNKLFYYIDTDEIPGFFLLLKKSYLHRAQRSYYFYLSCVEDIGVAMVTNMISQLQESFPLRRAAGSFDISFTKWLRGAKTVVTGDFLDELPNFHIDTFSKLEEHSGRFAENIYKINRTLHGRLGHEFYLHSKIKFVSPRGYVISSIYLVLKEFFKSELFSCLPKVDHLIKSCKEPVITIAFL